jgi:hypothetical protein
MEAVMQRISRSLARRFVAAFSVVVVSCGVLVAASATVAHALTICGPVGLTCPLANDDNYTTGFDKTLNVPAATGLLANDSGPVGTHVDTTISDTTSFNGATVNIQPSGAFSYIPDPTNPYSGTDTFNYEITDGAAGDTADATAYIVVVPVVANDTYYVHVNGTLNVAAPGVFANDDLAGIDPTSVTNDPTTAQNVPVTVADDGSFSYTPPHNFSGVDTFTYDVLDLNFEFDYRATVTIHVDSTPPTVALSAPPAVTLSTKIPVAWSGTDPGGPSGSGVGKYNVIQTVAPWNGGFAGWTNWLVPTTATSGSVTGTYGRTYCYRATAVDRAGNTSAPAQRCTTIPLRPASLSQTNGWTLLSNPAFFGNSAKTTTARGATLSRSGAQGRHFYLVATLCATCGTVQIRWNNVPTANLNLAHATTVHHYVFAIASLSAIQAGTLSIIVTSSGRPVVIEGLGILRQ